MLLKLPRELREEIYSYLLHCGDLAILRVSRQASLEALDRIYTEGLFRFYVNSAEAYRNVQLQDCIANRIQNVLLYWDLSNFDCQRNSHELIPFCQKQGVTRSTCHVILDADRLRAALLNASDISALYNLRAFRTVILETRIKSSTIGISSARLAKFRCRTLSMIRVLGDQLRLALGPAVQGGDVDARRLVFKPGSLWGSQFGEIPPSKTAYSW